MKKVVIITLIIVGTVFGLFNIYLKPMLPVLTGYAAKNLCSCVFVAGIDEEQAKAEDLGFSPIALASASVDYDSKSATANVWGLSERKAIYREGLGCVLVNDVPETTLAAQSFTPSRTPKDSLLNWFSINDTIDVMSDNQSSRIEGIIAQAFEEDDPEKLKNTRAIVVLYKGQLIAEKYAEGITQDTRLMGWSMTKSLTATMIGLLDQEGRLDIDDIAPIPEWQNDNRSSITIKHLLNMSSGLSFWENYEQRSDANIMFWESDSMGSYALSQPLEGTTGSPWYYSSGTTNILATMAQRFFNSQDDYLDYLNTRVFDKIGAYSMLIEPDGSGAYVGSSFGWATARDWARIGQLYLNKGQWAGEQILDPEWIDFVKTPTAGSDGWYGGHFWLNAGGRYPDAPRDIYSMDGFHAQKVFIIPSEELVIVRLGLTYNEPDFDFNVFLSELIEVLNE
ncbi:MAG: serine hydrolase [Cyclobacteriaceae bacterium]